MRFQQLKDFEGSAQLALSIVLSSVRIQFAGGWRGHLIQYLIELRPHVVAFRALYVAEGALGSRPCAGCLRFRLVVVKVEVPPTISRCEAFRVLYGDVRAIERAGEIPSPDGSDLEPSAFSACFVSCNSLKSIVPSGNTPVFL